MTTCVLTACLISSIARAQPASNPLEAINLVQNAGFEQLEEARPIGWTLTGVADLDNAQFYAGAMGLRMRHAKPATSSTTQIVQCGEREHLSLVWMKTQGVTGTGARIRLLGPAGQVIGQSKLGTGDAEWRQVRLPFNPGNTRSVTVELSLVNATGTVWFDDVVVAEAERVAPLWKDAPTGPQRENLALGKPYELSPPPSYQYCTDPDDDKQLTDGEYTVGYFWTQKSTVGWYLYSPQITVDLGKPEPLDGIMINCPGGGAAGVKFPNEITYLVSDDNEAFHEVARLTPRGLKQDGKNWYTHKFLADELKTRGRYVMIRLDKAGSTCFADEIEVYAGEHDPATVTFAGEPRNREAMAFAQYGITPTTYTRGHFPEWPHVKWATPLAGGPIKSILMAYSGDMREVVEVAQRLDLDYVPVQHFSYYRPTTLGDLMQEQIRKALPECQVMIVGGYRWEATPKKLIEQIKARVRAGMGLVCVSTVPQWIDPIRDVLDDDPLGDDQGLLDFVPVELLPTYRKPKKTHFQLGTYGQGRVAWINWATFTRGAHSLVPGFRVEDLDDDANAPLEYAFAALCKVVQWAAGRETARLAGIEASAGQVRVTLSRGETPVTLEVQVRDRYFDGGEAMTAQASKAGGDSLFSHDNHLHGANSVDVWVKDERGRILDFGSAAFTVEREASIESVEVAKPVFAPGEPIRATARIAGDKSDLRLSAVLFDTYGRQLDAAQVLTVGEDGTVTLEFRNDHPLTLCALLHVELRKDMEGKHLPGTERLDRRIERVWIDLPEHDDYTFCAWYAWDSQPAAFHGLKMLRDLGVDTYVSLPGAWRAENAAFVNMRHGPENVERVHPQNKDDSLVRQPCLTDPEYRAKVAARIDAMAQEVRPFGVLEWSLGDESTLGRRDYCHSPTCLAAFREYLKTCYPTLDALNESWATKFAAWNDVAPATLTEIEKRDHLGQWLDHRAYMEQLFADYHAWCADLIVKHVPEAKVGISGTPRINAYSGHDWWQLMQRSLTHLSGYGGVQRELQRSFLRPGTFYSTFLGYDYKDTDEQRARYSPWDLLFHGANGINYYTLMSNTLNCPMVRPDGSLTNKAPWFFEEVKELKAGMGKLFTLATREHDGIAVHYSPPSIHAAQAVGLFDHRDALRNYNINLTNVCKILQQCHYQFDFVHADQMAEGKLAEYKLLVLPWSSCLSDEEAAAIKAFVRAGGTVVADSCCGIRDEHGRPRAMLDDLFQIKQPLDVPELAAADLVLDHEAIRRDHVGEPLLEALRTVPVASGCGELQLAGAKSLAKVGDAPALIVDKHGQGTTIFLNCSFSNYSQVWDAGAAGEVLEEIASPQSVTKPMRDFVRALVRQAEVPVPLRVSVDGAATSELEVSRFAHGSAHLVGVVPSIGAGPVDRQQQVRYELVMDRPAHVYESRSGSYLGEVAKITGASPRGIAHVYAVLPYQVENVSVAGPTKARQGETVRLEIEVKAAGGRLGTHVVHVSVSGPRDGGGETKRRHYAQNVVLQAGKATVQIPLAHNDAPGEWVIQARDVMTGIRGRKRVTVKSP